MFTLENKIISREEAIKKGYNKFFDGKACEKGHVSFKRTCNAHCCVCAQEYEINRRRMIRNGNLTIKCTIPKDIKSYIDFYCKREKKSYGDILTEYIQICHDCDLGEEDNGLEVFYKENSIKTNSVLFDI